MPKTTMRRTLRALPPLLIAATLLTGCAAIDPLGGKRPRKPVYQNERFQADETFSRLFDAPVEATCEAARRALLSQGYVIGQAQDGLVQHLDLCVRPYLEDGTLARVLLSWVHPRPAFFLYVPSRAQMPAKTRALMDFLVEQRKKLARQVAQ